LLSFRRKPESSIYGRLQIIWTPAFAGVTTFYELVKFCAQENPVRKKAHSTIEQALCHIVPA